jgi:hypothetical protein
MKESIEIKPETIKHGRAIPNAICHGSEVSRDAPNSRVTHANIHADENVKRAAFFVSANLTKSIVRESVELKSFSYASCWSSFAMCG